MHDLTITYTEDNSPFAGERIAFNVQDSPTTATNTSNMTFPQPQPNDRDQVVTATTMSCVTDSNGQCEIAVKDTATDSYPDVHAETDNTS